MGVGLRFGFGPLRFYVPIVRGGRRRRRGRGRRRAPAWTHPGCSTRHRTQQTAQQCSRGRTPTAVPSRRPPRLPVAQQAERRAEQQARLAQNRAERRVRSAQKHAETAARWGGRRRALREGFAQAQLRNDLRRAERRISRQGTGSGPQDAPLHPVKVRSPWRGGQFLLLLMACLWGAFLQGAVIFGIAQVPSGSAWWAIPSLLFVGAIVATVLSAVAWPIHWMRQRYKRRRGGDPSEGFEVGTTSAPGPWTREIQ